MLPFDVLFACDGSESPLRAMLTRAGERVASAQDSGMYSKASPSTGMRHVGVVLGSTPIPSGAGSLLPEQRKGVNKTLADLLQLVQGRRIHRCSY